jgi:hypothetical protein
MSHRVLSPQQFFHGTNKAFSPGDVLHPPDVTGAEPNFPASDTSRVYVTTDLHAAGSYGKHVYRVTPHPDMGSDYYFKHARTTPHAVVNEMVGHEERKAASDAAPVWKEHGGTA